MRYKQGVKFIIGALALMSVIHLVSGLFAIPLMQYGIYPRNTDTLPHILFAPFIHGSWAHLGNNAVGFVIFSMLCLWRGYRTLLFISLVVVVLGGLLTWLVGRPAFHIGASGWVFGLWSASIAFAWFDRRFWSILIAIVVIVFYGGMIVGVLPQDRTVSFEGHLAGMVAGIAAVWAASQRSVSRVLRK